MSGVGPDYKIQDSGSIGFRGSADLEGLVHFGFFVNSAFNMTAWSCAGWKPYNYPITLNPTTPKRVYAEQEPSEIRASGSVHAWMSSVDASAIHEDPRSEHRACSLGCYFGFYIVLEKGRSFWAKP